MFLQSCLLALALAQGALSCDANNCARGVDGTRAGKTPDVTSRMADCSSFMLATVTPATSTILTTVTVPANTLVPNKKREAGARQLEQRQVTIVPSAVPAYASACSGTAGYYSACSCWGITAVTTTAVVPVTTSTVIITSPAISCGFEGFGSAQYEIGVIETTSGETCRQHCLSNPSCLSFGFGDGQCGSYTVPESQTLTPSAGSGFFFYDIACPDPFTSSKMVRAGRNAAVPRQVVSIDCATCAT